MSGPTNPTEAHFDKGSWGYNGTVWRKLGFIWNYGRVYAEAEIFTVIDAGTNIISFDPCPAGYVRVVTNVCAYVGAVAPTLAFLRLMHDAVVYRLCVTADIGANEGFYNVGDIILDEGDYLQFEAQGCGVGNELRMYAVGYDMAITQ